MQRIGDYVVHRLIGEGGMGKVYEAEERLSKRRVALKVLAPELSRSDDGRRMFLNEMTILGKLDHPNIVRSLASTEVDGDLVMALELLEGQTLRQYLGEHGRLSWTEAVDITAQVASALSAAHRQEPPIIHRDLKPENLMVLDNGRVKVMDFGIAKVLQAMSSSTTHSVGTLQYMSPEQIDAVPVDARSDLYSLGLVLYEMLAGKAPFESPSPRELLDMQCTKEPPPLPDEVRAGLPRGVATVLAQLLEKSPDDRVASAEQLIEALEPFGTAGDALPASQRAAHNRATASGGDETDDTGGPGDKTGGKASDKISGKTRNKTHGSELRTESNARRAAAAIDTARPVANLDTVALIERAGERRDISTRTGIIAILVLCAIAAVITYVLRVRSADSASTTPSGGPEVPTSAEVPTSGARP